MTDLSVPLRNEVEQIDKQLDGAIVPASQNLLQKRNREIRIVIGRGSYLSIVKLHQEAAFQESIPGYPAGQHSRTGGQGKPPWTGH